MDQAQEAVESSGLSAAEKQSRLASIEAARRSLLEHADGLSAVLFQRRQEAKRPLPARLGQLPVLGRQPQEPFRLGAQ